MQHLRRSPWQQFQQRRTQRVLDNPTTDQKKKKDVNIERKWGDGVGWGVVTVCCAIGVDTQALWRFVRIYLCDLPPLLTP